MAYYEELSPALFKIISERVLRNQDLCKLLYYYPDHYPNYDFDPLAEKDIENTNALFMKYVYPMPKMPDAKSNKNAYVCMYWNGGYEIENNTGYRNVVLNVEIICHLDCWNIKNGFRPYKIMNQIDKLLNNQLTDLPIYNKPYLRGFQTRTYSDYFYGVQMLYNMKFNSNIVCGGEPQNLNIAENIVYNPQGDDGWNN